MAKRKLSYPGLPKAYLQIAPKDPTDDSPHAEPMPGRYVVGSFHGRENVERFALAHLDYWQGLGSSDARNFRERIEPRDEVEVEATEDAPWIGDEFALFLDPVEFPTNGPDVKVWQWFDEANSYPSYFQVMREGGGMELLINSKRPDAGHWRGFKAPLPFIWGEWNLYTHHFLPRKGANAAALVVKHNGRTAFQAFAMSLIEDDARSMYAKGSGLYRSDVDKWKDRNGGATPPTVVSYVHGRRRFTPGTPDVVPTTPTPPVVTTPVPVPPQTGGGGSSGSGSAGGGAGPSSPTDGKPPTGKPDPANTPTTSVAGRLRDLEASLRLHEKDAKSLRLAVDDLADDVERGRI